MPHGEGLRVICELGPGEAGVGALEQIAELAALHTQNGGTNPVTIRLAWGDPLAGGGAAAVDPLARLLGTDGLKLVEPVTAADAKGLLVSSIRDDTPVCVLAHAELRGAIDTVPEGSHRVEIGRARLAREGERISVVAHGVTVGPATAALDDAGLDADLLDLRTLQPLDTDAVLTSLRKTGRILFVEPANGTPRVTSELVSAVWERAFEHLDAPARRVRLPDTRVNGHGPDDGIELIGRECGELLEY